MAARDRGSWLLLTRLTTHHLARQVVVTPWYTYNRETGGQTDGVPRQGTSWTSHNFPRFRGRGLNLRGERGLFGHGNHMQHGPVWAAAQLHCAQRDGPGFLPPQPALPQTPQTLGVGVWASGPVGPHVYSTSLTMPTAHTATQGFEGPELPRAPPPLPVLASRPGPPRIGPHDLGSIISGILGKTTARRDLGAKGETRSRYERGSGGGAASDSKQNQKGTSEVQM